MNKGIAKLKCGRTTNSQQIKTIKRHLKDGKMFGVILFIILGIFIRIQELGYSNLQGDEINPLDYLYENNFIYYILNQKRGPLQYLINFVNTSLFGYINEFQVRLPYFLFALAGFVTLYLLTKKIFDRKTALYATALLSINGLFIAFSRIAQYQSFLFLALPLAGYLFVRHFEKRDRVQPSKGLNPLGKFPIPSAIIYSLCLLAHYDALSMLPFFGLFVFGKILRMQKQPRPIPPQKPTDSQIGDSPKPGFGTGLKAWLFSSPIFPRQVLKDSVIFTSIALIPNLLFYGAMRFNPYYEAVTKTYLGNRLRFGGFMPRLPDIMPIVSLYIPKHYLLVLLILLVIGLIGLVGQITEIGAWKIKFSRSFVAAGYISLCLLLAGATVFSYYPIKPRTATLLVLGASVGITTILLLSKKVKPEIVGLVGWFLFPYCVYFFIIRDPRTHIYTAFIPGFILAGRGIKKLIGEISNRVQPSRGLNPIGNIIFALFIAFLAFESAVVWQMFVDKVPEYPWWNKTVLGWSIYTAGHSQHQKPEGVFGVPYYRGWEILAKGLEKGCPRGSFHSNEKNSISYFYTRINQVGKDEADNLVLVEGPHSWKFIEESGYEPEKKGYTLIKTIKSPHGLPVMYIWGKSEFYPEGKPFCEF